VKLEEVDPFQMDKSYFLTPSKGAGHAYALLREGMERTKRVGIARWVMHTKQHLCIVRPVEGGLGVTTLAFADELLKMPEHESAGARPKERELKMAEELIENMAASFEPEKFKDDHRERVIAILERKAKGEDIVSTEETDTKPTKVTSLAKMLEESLSQAKAGSLRFQRQAARTGRAAKAKAPAKAASTKRARAR
jgi:DNA end-binding protein Ku